VLPTNRKSPRVRIDLLVLLDSEGAVSPALAINVGLGGMFIEGPDLAYGQFVDVIAKLPGLEEPARIPAVVRWTKDRGIGLQFLQLGAQVTHALSQLVSSSSAA
jgi:hypothetical protein